eukprot:gene10820-13257_t
MCDFYQQASNVIDGLIQKKGSIKGLSYNNKNESQKTSKTCYALVCETLKYKEIIDEIIELTPLIKKEKLKYSLLIVMIYELLFSQQQSIKGGGKDKKIVLNFKNQLSTALARLKIKKKVSENIDLLPEHIRNPVVLPRYVRINTIAKNSSIDKAIKTFKDEGYQLQVDNGGGGRDMIKSISGKEMIQDKDFPEILVFPSNIDLHDHKMLHNGEIILQDKASCLPAFVLAPRPGSTVIDSCSAPGNKTSLLSALMNNTGKVYAIEKDKFRLQTLQKLTKRSQCTNIETVHDSFLNLKYDDERFKDVEFILCDPSCSGSGIVNRLDYLLPSKLSGIDENENIDDLLKEQQQLENEKEIGKETNADENKDNKKNNKKRKAKELKQQQHQKKNLTKNEILKQQQEQQKEESELKEKLEKENEEKRIKLLADFQLSIIMHAFGFPNVKKVVYSTCSIHQVENEDVVQRALDELNRHKETWKITNILPHWNESRGFKTFNNSIKSGNGTSLDDLPMPRELKRATTVDYIFHDQENSGKMKPLNGFVTPLLTDMYQITMAYSLWKNNRHNIPTVFDLYFRKNPFGGEFTVFAGLEEVIRFISDYHFTSDDLAIIKSLLGPDCDEGFIEYLSKLDASEVTIYALKEGSVVFPRIPLIRVEGPLAVCQLFETTLLCLVNFASLVATNAARHRLAVGRDKVMLEFGLRRAQGPDGAMSASRYSYLGGADGTSNVLAHSFFGIPVKGTHAHSYVTSYNKIDDLQDKTVVDTNGVKHDLLELAMKFREELGYTTTVMSELIAFTAYARTFPKGFLALVDTYDTLSSGVPNFICLSLALHQLGYKALGIRLDSGDLAYLSKAARKMFKTVAAKYGIDYFEKFSIVASNDLNESTILALNRQGHEIDVFAIGTNLVTCQAQPALGCVFKLVEIDGSPRIKLSQETNKVTLPGRKEAYRLYGSENHPLVDLLVSMTDHTLYYDNGNGNASPPTILAKSQIPEPGKKTLCLHPFEEQKRVFVTPTKVEPLHHMVYNKGSVTQPLPTLEDIRKYCMEEISKIREDHVRSSNPTPYKVSVSENLYNLLHNLWLQSVPIKEMK